MASIMQYSVAETPTKKFQCALCRFESEFPQLVRESYAITPPLYIGID